MSFLIEHLLIESLILKEEHDLESDSYNDLLIIEKKIKELKEKGLFTENEYKILTLISEGYFYEDVEKILGIGRATVSKIFTETCNRLSYYLGGNFTDEGTIDDLKERYRLTEKQIKILEDYIKSRYRHKIRHSKNFKKDK